MRLDVAPTQKTPRRVSIGQLDVKGIIAAGFAVADHVNHIGESPLMVNLRSALDVTRVRTGRPYRVSCYTSSVHVHTGSVVLILQMAQELAVMHAATDTEGSLAAGGRVADPPAAGHEIAWAATATTYNQQRTKAHERTSADSRERRAYNCIHDPRRRHVKSIHCDTSVLVLHGTSLLIEDHHHAAR